MTNGEICYACVCVCFFFSKSQNPYQNFVVVNDFAAMHCQRYCCRHEKKIKKKLLKLVLAVTSALLQQRVKLIVFPAGYFTSGCFLVMALRPKINN